MGLTEEERFRFDLTGFLVRPAILTPDEVAAIVDQADRIRHNPESLPPEQRAIPGGAASLLIDHPRVIEVLHEIIGARCPVGGLRIDLAVEGGVAWRTPRRWTGTGGSHLRLSCSEWSDSRRDGASCF